MPKRLSASAVESGEDAAVLTEEDQPASCRKRTARASSTRGLPIVPNLPSSLKVQSANIPPAAGHSCACSVKEALAHLERPRNLAYDVTRFIRRKEQQFKGWSVRRRHPVGSGTGTSEVAFRRRIGVRNQNRFAVLAVAARPGNVFHERLRQ